MTNSKSKFVIAALLAISALMPAGVAYAGDRGPAKWLDAWRYVRTESAEATADVLAADIPLLSIRQQIPGVNCAAEAVPLAVAKPVTFHSCRAPAPRNWVALNPPWPASSSGAQAGIPVG
jgi:hypothetical protein